MVKGARSVVIVGAGHNGLVAAFYLARAGFRTTIVERRSVPGGLCVTEELIPGYRISSVANWFGMLRTSIIDDLGIRELLKTHLPRTAEFTLFQDGTYFLPTLGFPIPLRRQNEVRRTGLRDHYALHRLHRELKRAAKLLHSDFENPPCSIESLEQRLHSVGLHKIAKSLFSDSWFDFIDERFRSDKIKAMLCSYTFGSPLEIGSVLSPIFALTARTNNSYGSWGFIEGGMGRITEAIAARIKSLGVKIRLECPVKRILVEKNTAYGVELESGDTLEADYVVSNADPYTTLVKLMPDRDGVVSDISSLKRDYVGSKVHLALRALPRLSCDIGAEICHRLGGVVITPSLEEVCEAARSAAAGELPKRNIITLYFPSQYDSAAAPKGKHLLSLDTHFNPAHINDQHWSEKDEERYLQSVISQLERHMPDIGSLIEAHVVVSPGRLEEEYGCYRGAAWHVDLTPDQAFDKRPLNSYSDYTTPVKNLFLCGAGTHPAGTVTGIGGRNCANTVIRSHL